jgi:kynurenine formamidase
MTPTRPLYEHNVLVERNGRDDSLDSFFMSHTSQWDRLRHVKFGQHRCYGGRTDDEIDRTGELGINRVSARGIVGRGVLIDVVGYKAARGEAWDPHQRYKITAGELDQVLAHHNVELEADDILLLRTGWWPSRLKISEMEGSAGLDPSNETAAWLWDHQVAAVAADNGAVECSPLLTRTEGFVHYRLPALGMFLGELFDLDALAADRAEDGVFTGLLVSSPLRIPQGVCSPPNAYVIK